MSPRMNLTKERQAHVMACFDRALKAEHMVFSPLRGQTTTALIRRMRHETDTGLVMLLTMWVEQALTDLLRAFLIRDAHAGSFLKGLGGKLDQKIALVYALGIYWRDQRDDADLLKNIRNRFAHRVLTGTFRDKEVAELVDRLHFAHSHPGRSRRWLFIYTADRVVYRARVARRLVQAMRRGEMGLGELRVFFAQPSVIPPAARAPPCRRRRKPAKSASTVSNSSSGRAPARVPARVA